jgi:hypothetical protein
MFEETGHKLLHLLHPSSLLPVPFPHSHTHRTSTAKHQISRFVFNLRQISSLKSKATCAYDFSIDKMLGQWGIILFTCRSFRRGGGAGGGDDTDTIYVGAI